MRYTGKLICLICLYFLVFNSYGQGLTARRMPDGLGYLEYLPPNYNSNTDLYPLMIFLHGHGERGDGSPSQLERIKSNGPPKLINNGEQMCFEVNGTTECFIVLCPQTSRNGWQGFETMPFIDWAIENYRVDPDRVYMTGLSMGGQGSWQVAYSEENQPNRFAAIAPAPGRGGYQETCYLAEIHLPVWAFHGEADNQMPLHQGRTPINGMIRCNADPAPIFTTYPGVGHAGCWNRAYRTDNTLHTPNLYQWLLLQSRGAAPEIPPSITVNANYTITLPDNSLSITANATDADGTIESYQWTLLSGPNSPNISGSSTATVSLDNLIEGTYSLEITVTDNDNLSASRQITITVLPEPANIPPTANAGPNREITLPQNTISINGSGSDSDGEIVSYEWNQESGPNTADISDPNAEDITLDNLIEGTYSFILTVTDDDGDTGSDAVTVTVFPTPANSPPSANAGNNRTITLPTSSITINGSGEDSDGTIVSYSWAQNSGPNTPGNSGLNQSSLSLTNLIEGVYTFSLTVEDDDGDTDSDQITITVLPVPPNSPPNANAGSDQEITLPTSTTTISGQGTDSDGSVTDYLWEQVQGPNTATIDDNSASQINVSNLIEGVYTFSLTVTDDDGDESSDEMVLTVLPIPPNDPPTAIVPNDTSITLPVNSLELTGFGLDTDGTVVSYLWQRVQGPSSVTFSSNSTPTTTVSGLIEGTYLISLTVTDDDGDSDTDQVTITVFPETNNAPTAIIENGSTESITLPTNSIILNGNGTDPDGTIVEYLWEQISGPSDISMPSPDETSINLENLVEGIYVISFTVTDDDNATNSTQITITVNPEPVNTPPVANAGPDIILTLPDNSTTINGSGTDSDGTIVSYHWEFISGPADAGYEEVNQANLELQGLEEGIYVFSLTVEDDRGAFATDEVSIIVNSPNLPPVVSAGPDRTITLPTSSLTLNGSATDSDGQITFYLWEQESGPNTATTTDVLNPQITLQNLVEGVYIFSLYAEDNEGASNTDHVRITVRPEPPNNPPTANAGSDRAITLPTSSITLSGSGSDSDGTIASYQWSQKSGPSSASSSGANQANVTFSNLVEGLYVFTLRVTDNRGDRGTDDIRVTVRPYPGNQFPTVNLGNDRAITLPDNSISLSANATDPDGTIQSYSWTKVSGPVSGNIVTPNQANTNIQNLTEGVYIFNCRVTDNDNASASDNIKVTVNPVPANKPPIADAGENKIITLPENETQLIGEGLDADGSIASYMWEQKSGPNTATVTGSNNAIIQISNLVEGIYIFRLTVQDDDGSTAFDEVNITVEPLPANQPPIVNAGENQTIYQPASQTTFNGTAEDDDGSITSYIWSQVSGPNTASLTGSGSATLNATNLILGTYVFRLTATDNEGLQGFDEVNVRVNPENPNLSPSADAGEDITLTLPENSAEITGTGSDPDGTVTDYLWTVVTAPSTVSIIGGNTPNVRIENLIEGTYVLRLTVTDDEGDRDFDEVQITVLPSPPNEFPIVDAGTNQSLVLPGIATLSATASDPDGTIISYQWTQRTGPSQSMINSPSSSETTVDQLEYGTYVFRCTVTDNNNQTAFDEVNLLVSDNYAPVAFAGNDQRIVFPQNDTYLTGGASDLDGEIVSRMWTQISGPTSITIASPQDSTIHITNMQIGSYTFSFEVTDDKGAIDTDEVTIEVVNSNGNIPPVANAGEDVTITMPTSSVVLNGSGTDEDGSIRSYEWEQISGGNTTTSELTFAQLIVGGLREGEYQFKLTVTDTQYLTDTDTVNITVLPLEIEAVNIPRLFTPNGDGINDYWEIANLQALGEVEVRIYDSRGNEIYHSKNYGNDWGGTSNGQLLQPGPYFYEITARSGTRRGGVRIIY
ncbi:PKD domain-containing protein [Fulvivirga maritima]|uniref:PKD domain-containing protein n=1 Tax=Fulvivirga maritima TaxID=2904247 RepID=UPI001F365937|nr:PKD domain-containing protein [Fulvivirga maritima]UII25518.1 PKD domain-containing protein [Fulvivirga maritima]